MAKLLDRRLRCSFASTSPIIALVLLCFGAFIVNSQLRNYILKCPLPIVLNNSTPSEKILPPQEVRSMVNYGQIMMDGSEVDMLLKYVLQAKTYIEWGSGGSTYNFPQFVGERFVSIEHDNNWCQNVTQSAKHSRVEMHCVSPRDGRWRFGNRSDPDGRYPNFRNYVNEIDNLGVDIWDFALVDGRARVDVAIKLLSYISPNSYVALHDGLRIRYTYKEMQNYYSIVDAATGKNLRAVLILKRKRKWDHLQGEHAEVQKMLDIRNKNVL